MTVRFCNDQPDVFLSIVREVGQWLADNGHEMWEIDTLTPENLFDVYTRDNAYVLYADETPAATFILQWKDPLYYADVPDNTAGFIHKVAIRRQFAGQNLFAPILDFCRAECLKRGIHEIQLETDATRPALMRFYERYGFVPTYQKIIHEFGQTFLCQYYVLQF
ncbi:GNAT family N-acetyltransferase [Spirosoma montaniterrae]|uniref:GCN5 family acetyltransferase n=1 Tax=Spirosoma montaniterrae TaxID=1178516 RepID=A0A1P9WS35_9BACT|nr:GNAT family N-acetyltransferase [Spirosoma montaniterrae]AQG78184.1 GCN5 family acetyltransferase [Spirosoma montaniterrae]